MSSAIAIAEAPVCLSDRARGIVAESERLTALAASNERELVELTAQLEELERRLALSRANSAGRQAEAEAFAVAHPDSPLHGDSGRAFRDGRPKSVARVVYEDAFDAALRARGIDDPASYRED